MAAESRRESEGLRRLREAVARRAGVPAEQVDLADCSELLPHRPGPCSAHCPERLDIGHDTA